MSDYKLTYFDMKGGRGQVARLAFELGGVDFEDYRVSYRDFPPLKSSFPFGSMPTLEHKGEVLAQCNAINRFVGKLCKLYPDDPWQAALCDQAMDAVEDVDNKVMRSLFLKDEEEKKVDRAALAAGPIRVALKGLAGALERQGGEYFADGRLTVADLKVFVWVRYLGAGIVDYLPTDLPQQHAPILVAHHERILDLPVIRKHYA